VQQHKGQDMATKIKIGDIEAEILPDEECAKAETFVCLPKYMYDKDPSTSIPGTVGGFFCSLCNQEVVLAPSGQQLNAMREHYKKELTCLDCMLKMTVQEQG